MIGSAISLLLSILWPKAPSWLGRLISFVLPMIVEFVEELSSDKYQDLSGLEKRTVVIDQLGEVMDAMDSLPQWNDLPEEERDRMISGLIDFALFISRAAPEGKAGRNRQLKRAFRRIFKARDE